MRGCVRRQGERNYRALKGDTGPLVYPAGFLYAFSVLHWLTGGGRVRPAQLLFAGIYLATLGVVLWLYVKAKARLFANVRIGSLYNIFNKGFHLRANPPCCADV